MKIRNKTLTPPTPVKVTIYRVPENFEFVCNPVLDYSDFEKLCPEPAPPITTRISTGVQYPNTQDKKYLARMDKWAEMKRNWVIITSLRGSPELEWETVKYDDPNTWGNYEKELNAVLTMQEYNRLLNAIFSANNPTEASLTEARESFLATAVAKDQSTDIQTEEVTSIPSGEPVSV